MMRGIAYFKCPKCGKVFRAPDLEANATTATVPMPCPDCGTKSPKVRFSLWDTIIAKLKDL